MPERGIEHRGPERAGGGCADDGHDADEQLRRALAQREHARDARRFFEQAPLYLAQPEDDGTTTLRRKQYDYRPDRPPAAATRWRVLSTHRSLEEAERRLRHIASPPIFYDERGRLAPAPPPPPPERDGDPPAPKAW